MTDPTTRILDYFEKINAIPRCSSNETRLCKWLQHWATERHLDYHCDKANNLVIRVPASKGYESAPIVVLQGHMDMVCEKTPDSTHNFNRDPIISHREGDWLTAVDTTLGADNGIAIAYMLALVEDESVHHPALELLITVDEETGLNGAKKLDPEFITGRFLINLDSEDEGIFTVGCAGGVDTTITLATQHRPIPASGNVHRLVVGGLKGGHSGMDIHKHRGNANKILARTIAQIQSVAPLRLISFSGGTRKNAIPRDAEAVVWIDPSTQDHSIEHTVVEMAQTIKNEFAPIEKDLFIHFGSVSMTEVGEKILDGKSTEQIIQMLLCLPNGVCHMSPEFDGVVETSSNLATVTLAEDKLIVLCSQRSASISRLDEITNAVHAVANLAGAKSEDHEAYSPWQPMVNSVLLDHSQKAYHMLYGRKPTVQVIHAGLECAVIGDIYPGMDMISFGPTIRNPHSPDERILISSVEKIWDFLIKLLADLK